ncbi:MAG: potassium transporter [Magnetococcales bacterium]|nr:potassium transporter [Magnetococcales bacterium]
MSSAVNELSLSRLLVVSFILTILVGAFLLWLPVSRLDGVAPVSWVDALFTSTSAVCVTGLTVRDTGTTFSLFGQVVIIVLIQVGGLGFLTFSTYFLSRFYDRKQGLGAQHRHLLEISHGSVDTIHPAQLLRAIFLFTFAAELVGALLLFVRFSETHPAAQAGWEAVFHAISAFCNAGFGLFEDNLMGYRADPLVSGTIMTLIVMGGLGFLVYAELWQWFLGKVQKRRHRLSLHSRLVLRTSLLLIVVGGVAISALEWDGEAMGDQPWVVMLESFFLSVSARTAGFNSVDTGLLTAPTLFLVALLMVIGGSPGSTAGGMKTTTAAVCFFMLRSKAFNRPRVECLERSLPEETVNKAMLVVTGYVLAIIIGVFLLQLTEIGRQPFSKLSNDLFLGYLFETISALGTVGLSANITPTLSSGGKLVIVALMFVGRIGPLLAATAVIGGASKIQYAFAEENVNIG